MIQLKDKATGTSIGVISRDDLQFLIDNLEEESETDTDYYINRSTLAFFREKEPHSALVDLLENAMGDREEMDIEWVED